MQKWVKEKAIKAKLIKKNELDSIVFIVSLHVKCRKKALKCRKKKTKATKPTKQLGAALMPRFSMYYVVRYGKLSH